MKLPIPIIILIVFSLYNYSVFSQKIGIDNTSEYVPLLYKKTIGLVVNKSSVINDVHLIDTLISLGLNVKKIFSPEHGFDSQLSAGEYVHDSTYNDTIPIISLYGKNKKPKYSDLNDLDVLVFDIQDVGVRFYTYISTLHYVMEACAENELELIVLDRPNPHANYIDGPILQESFSSFVGMHPVPIVYGMTIGEYALMINGEQWLKHNIICNLSVVKIQDYDREKILDISFNPSPNLKSMLSIFLYPSLCLFEGTIVSVGRGTDYPFEIYGAPFFKTNFSFTPQSNTGSKNPKHQNKLCYGVHLKHTDYTPNRINLSYILNAYYMANDDIKQQFFNNFFSKLAGNNKLRLQIENNVSENLIRKSWKKDLKKFSKVREKYLLYN